MQDNVSLVLAIIVFVLVLVLMPTLSVLARQDNISSNVVLTLTTDFVDSIRSKGYIDEAEYFEYEENLANTGNRYEIKLEIYETMYVLSGEEYVEQRLLKNNNDIFGKDAYGNRIINSATEVVNPLTGERIRAYELSEGDEIYIKVYNTNTTFATILYSFFAGKTQDSKVITVDYGGQVYSKVKNEYDMWVTEREGNPVVRITGIYNELGKTTYIERESATGSVNRTLAFNVNERVNRMIQLQITVYNAETILGYSIEDNESIEAAIKSQIGETGTGEYIKFYIGDTSRPIMLEWVGNSNYRDGVYSFMVYADISKMARTLTTAQTAYISIEEGFGKATTKIAENENIISSAYVSDSFYITKPAGEFYESDSYYNEYSKIYEMVLSAHETLADAQAGTNAINGGRVIQMLDTNTKTIFYRVAYTSDEWPSVVVAPSTNGYIVNTYTYPSNKYNVYEVKYTTSVQLNDVQIKVKKDNIEVNSNAFTLKPEVSYNFAYSIDDGLLTISWNRAISLAERQNMKIAIYNSSGTAIESTAGTTENILGYYSEGKFIANLYGLQSGTYTVKITNSGTNVYSQSVTWSNPISGVKFVNTGNTYQTRVSTTGEIYTNYSWRLYMSLSNNRVHNASFEIDSLTFTIDDVSSSYIAIARAYSNEGQLIKWNSHRYIISNDDVRLAIMKDTNISYAICTANDISSNYSQPSAQNITYLNKIIIEN